MSSLRSDGRGIVLAVIAVVIVVILVIAVLAILFLPFREVNVNESRESTLSEGMESMSFALTLDAGVVEVQFVDDSSTAISMSVTGKARTGLLSGNEQVDVSWSESTDRDSLNVTSTVKLGGSPGLFRSNNINCTVRISQQLKTSLTINNGFGAVDVRTVDGVELTGANIKTSTGGARLDLVSNTTLSGPLTMESSVGGIDLRWNNVNASDDTLVLLKSSTGGVRASFDQTEPTIGIVSIGINTDVGGIDATVNIAGEVSGRVVSSVNVGDVNVQEQSGFNGTSDQLESENYPTASQINMTCTAQTGGVNLRVNYES